MAITNQSRHELHQRLEETIGKEPAATLMDHLPPVGWADVATKESITQLRDHVDGSINLLREELDERFNVVDERFNVVDERFNSMDERFTSMATRAELHKEIRSLIFLMITAFCAIAGLVVGAIKAF
jgi:hypothetical protein